MAISQCIKFHLMPFFTLRDILRTSFLLQNNNNVINNNNNVFALHGLFFNLSSYGSDSRHFPSIIEK